MGRLTAGLLAAVMLVGCVGTPDDEAPEDRSPDEHMPGLFAAGSIAFGPGDPIPRKHTCDGDNVSPQLEVINVPEAARTVALILGDPDVPTRLAPARNFTHWILWNAVPVRGLVEFPEGAPPAGAVEGNNDAGEAGYRGPCPPQLLGRHRYVFTFFAVDSTLDLAAGADRAALERALDGHVVAQATLVGTYERAAP